MCEGSGEVAEAKLRDIFDILPALPMAAALRRFVDWVSAYTLAPPGAVLRSGDRLQVGDTVFELMIDDGVAAGAMAATMASFGDTVLGPALHAVARGAGVRCRCGANSLTMRKNIW